MTYNYKDIASYLKAKADANNVTAAKLTRVADAIPNHKTITRRLCVEDTYISDYYSKQFRIPVETIVINDYRRDGEPFHRTKADAESVYIHDGSGRLPETTVAALKDALKDIAATRANEAAQLRLDAKTVEKRHTTYLKAVAAFEAARDALTYTERSALDTLHLTR